MINLKANILFFIYLYNIYISFITFNGDYFFSNMKI